ncbi:MAG: KamA family radical SAM protein [Bdellovibrionales bacterium]|nr:KamA family radical SAM protein [Bdellovibrionales bacterium]
MALRFPSVNPAPAWKDVSKRDWRDWHWQMRASLTTLPDFETVFDLSAEEIAGFNDGGLFQVRTSPYYASLADSKNPLDPLRRVFMPHARELTDPYQSMLDPLGEKKNSASPRVIHRYSDRALFLVTDVCGTYCRFCTRKHFTASNVFLPTNQEYQDALRYIRSHPGIREVILSGGDPLTLSDTLLDRILTDLRNIDHVEIIRLGSRMPVINPFRVTPELAGILRKHAPVFVMSHFNHPRELSEEAARALTHLVDHGIPVMNQMVLLNGVNNHAAIVQALSRRLLYLRVKPYYMFQCDPSFGTDHLRTSVEESLEIQKELWGHLSGLAMPTLALDIPNGGGKSYLVPDFQISKVGNNRTFRGWDGVEGNYVSPPRAEMIPPADAHLYQMEWDQLRGAKQGCQSRSISETMSL